MTENRYWLHAAIKHDVGSWKTKLKTKCELRDLEGEDVWRIRAKLKVQRPIRVGGKELVPYFAEEPFYSFSKERWNQNRAFFGVNVPINDHLEIALYYLNKAKNRGEVWTSDHIIGTEVVIPF